jgi:hypothetical protein
MIASEYTNACIQDQHSHIWVDGSSNLDHLLEKLSLLFMSSRGIYDDDFESLLLELSHALGCDSYGVRFCVRAKVGYLCFGCRLPCLVKRSSTECISTNDGRFKTTLLVVHCEFGTGGRFAISL